VQNDPVRVLALRGLAVAAPGVVNVDVDTHGCGVGLVVKVGSSSMSLAHFEVPLLALNFAVDLENAKSSRTSHSQNFSHSPCSARSRV